MSGRDDLDLDESTAVRGNGNGRVDTGDGDAPIDLSSMSDRRLLERTYRVGIENEQRITTVYNALQAHRVDESKRWRAIDGRVATIEEGVFELVASDRSRRHADETLRKELHQSIADVKADLERKVAETKRASLVDEEERKVIADMASVSVEAARSHVGARTVERAKQNELVVADQADALQARKERRELAVAGAKRVATIVLPILTGLAIAAAALLQKGC